MGGKRLPLLVLSGVIVLVLILATTGLWSGGRPDSGPDERPIESDAPPPPLASDRAASSSMSATTPAVILVRDQEGRPTRATVFATGLANRPPQLADWIGETGADGRLEENEFRRKPRGSVFATAPGQVALPVPVTPRGAELVIKDGVVVTGLVCDEAGVPVSGVVVVAGQPYLGDSAWSTTGPDGHYRMTGLLPAKWTIVARLDEFTWQFEVEPTTFDETVEVDFSDFPVPDCTVLLDVRYSSPPQADPWMIVSGTERNRKTRIPRSDAMVRVGAKDKCTVEIVCPGFQSVSVALDSGSHAREPIVRVDLMAGGGMPHSILVVDSEGRSVPEALILLMDSEDDHHPTTKWTGPDGRLALNAHLRGYLAVASASQGASPRTRIVAGVDEIVLGLRPAAVLTGRVLDRETGGPVSDARVRLTGGDCPCCSPWTVTTNESGEYRFVGIPAGLFVMPYASGGPGLSGTRAGISGSHSEAVAEGRAHLVAGTETVRFADLLVTRYETFICSFRVEPPMLGEQVRITRLVTGGSYYRRLEEDEPVTLELRRGEHLLRFESDGLIAVVVVDAERDAASGEILIHLEPPLRVTAVLVDPDGKKVFCSGQRVDVDVLTTVDGEVRRIGCGGESADSDGRADLTGDLLATGPPGIVNELSLGQGRFHLVGEPIRITAAELAARAEQAGGEVVIEIPVATANRNSPMAVVVTDRSGRPVPGVRIGDPDEPDQGVVTDEAGRATVSRYWEPIFPFMGDWNLPDRPGSEPVRVEVERARKVRLRFLDPRGVPIADEEIWATEYLCCGETNGEGRVELTVPDRLEGLEFERTEFWVGFVDLPRDAGEIEVRTVAMRELAISVSGEDALSVERSIQIEWEVDNPGGVVSSGDDSASRKGDRWRGTIALPSLPARVRAVTYNLRYEARAEVLPGTRKLELRLAELPVHEVILIMLDSQGVPLVDCEIDCDRTSLSAGALVPQRARTDQAGRLVLELPAGPHRLEDLEVGEHRIEEVRFASPSPGEIEVRLGESQGS